MKLTTDLQKRKITLQQINPFEAKYAQFLHFYAPTDSGKTTSILQSAPEPITYIMGEPRNPRPSIEAIIKTNNKKVQFYKDPILFDDSVDLRVFLAGQLDKPSLEYKTLFFDGVSHFMNVSLGSALSDELYESMKDEVKKHRSITQRTARDVKIYGALAREMVRIFDLLAKLVFYHGITVITTSLMKTITRADTIKDLSNRLKTIPNPQWDKLMDVLGMEDNLSLNSYQCPDFDGLKFLDQFPGALDMIGVVEKRYDKDNNPIWPPIVSFRSRDALTKHTGVGEYKTELNIKKILGMDENGNGVKKAEVAKEDKK